MNKENLFVALISMWAASPAFSDVCQVNNAHVTGIFQWSDGHIFVELDKEIGCGCSLNKRAAFHKNDDERFYMSGALTALSTGMNVMIRADNVNGTCPIHGNTAKLITLKVSK